MTRSVPTLVVYNAPGRDCSQYSSGGAGSDEAYRAWIDGFAAGLRPGQRVIVVVEPDGLANLPSDCPAAYPGQDVAALTAGRIADIRYAATAIKQADAAAQVYLDAGHSAWHSVGDIAQRLDQAGVADVEGFSLNVSNYQPTPQLDQYGTWISKCLYYANNPAEGGWRVGHYDYCASQYYPATVGDYSTWHLTDEWYAANVDAAAGAPTGPDQLAHFVVDTSRNGRGPWTTTTAVPGQAGLVQSARAGPRCPADREHRSAPGRRLPLDQDSRPVRRSVQPRHRRCHDRPGVGWHHRPGGRRLVRSAGPAAGPARLTGAATGALTHAGFAVRIDPAAPSIMMGSTRPADRMARHAVQAVLPIMINAVPGESAAEPAGR